MDRAEEICCVGPHVYVCVEGGWNLVGELRVYVVSLCKLCIHQIWLSVAFGPVFESVVILRFVMLVLSVVN